MLLGYPPHHDRDVEMEFSGTENRDGPPSLDSAVQFLGRPDIVGLVGAEPSGFNLTRLNSEPIAAEIVYRETEYPSTVRNWTTGWPLIDAMYPGQQERVDEHLMNHLGNVVGVPNVLETFTTADFLGPSETEVDDEPVVARRYRWGSFGALLFEFDGLIVTYVAPAVVGARFARSS